MFQRYPAHTHTHTYIHTHTHITALCLILLGTSYGSSNLVKLREYLPTVAAAGPVCVVVGAIAHGAIDAPWVEQDIAVSQYAMSAAGVCAKLTDACEGIWDVL